MGLWLSLCLDPNICFKTKPNKSTWTQNQPRTRPRPGQKQNLANLKGLFEGISHRIK
jgi:hypothetical protein